MLLDFQTNADNENNFYLQVAREFSKKADNKNKEFESYRIQLSNRAQNEADFQTLQKVFSLSVKLNTSFQ